MSFRSSPSATPDSIPAKAVPFVKRLKETVAFIQLRCRSGGTLLDVKGTGFFAFYPDERVGKNRGFAYLVTNRHVAQCWDEKDQPMQVMSIALRMNFADGGSRVIYLNQNGNIPWLLPTDDSVDLAIFPLALDQKMIEYLPIPTSVFVTDELIASREINEGARIVFSGFFVQFQGEHRMQPIVREGIIAMMPDEKLVNTTGKLGKVFLGDVHIFGGNSGSPVFVDLAGVQGGSIIAGEDYRLLGVVSGYFYEDEELSLKAATTLKGKAHANSGIAIIVPASALKDLIDDPRLQQKRDGAVAGLRPSN
jgi:hypothetical protein